MKVKGLGREIREGFKIMLKRINESFINQEKI